MASDYEHPAPRRPLRTTEMRVMTVHGFYSVVQDRANHNRVIVRGKHQALFS
jgi:hypothetical protein